MKVSAGFFRSNRSSTMIWAACLVCLTAICLAVTASASPAQSSPETRRCGMWPRLTLTPWTFSENVSDWKITRARLCW